MPIITISRRTFDKSEEIATRAARRLGYRCLEREVFAAAAREYQVPTDRLEGAILGAPSLLGMSWAKRKRYIAMVQASLAGHMLEGDLVYYGPAGHLLIQGVSHVLRARIVASLEERVLRRSKLERVSESAARRAIARDDKHRKKWVRLVYDKGVDDPDLYDLVINVGQISIDQAVDILTSTVSSKRFAPNTYSKTLMRNIELSARVRAHLVALDPDVVVRSDHGKVHILTKASAHDGKKNADAMSEIAGRLDGVKSVTVQVSEDLLQRMAGQMR